MAFKMLHDSAASAILLLVMLMQPAIAQRPFGSWVRRVCRLFVETRIGHRALSLDTPEGTFGRLLRKTG